MNGFDRRKERKKDAIRHAARELFTVQGFNKVSIMDIARKANVSQVTIYNHFGSKQDMVHDVVRRIIDEQLELLKSIITNETLSFTEKITRVMLEKDRAGKLYNSELIEFALSDDPELKKYLDDIYRQGYELTATLLNEGKKLGYVDRELSMESIVAFGQILTAGLKTYFTGSMEQLKDSKLLTDIRTMYCYGVLGKPRKED